MVSRKQKQGWDVRTNLGAAPGSQGTLFSGGKSQMSDARYPRGYTPERQSAVHEAVQPAYFTAKDSHKAVAEIRDTVARSTVPVEHLRGLQFAVARDDEYLTTEENRAGKHLYAGIHIKSGSPEHPSTIALRPNATRGGTVIHEIGHHVSHGDGNEHSVNYSSASEHGGHEEAFADNYAETHFRDRKGKQVDQGIYGGGEFAGTIQRSKSFWDGYRAHREYPLMKAANAASDAIHYQRYPEDRVHPDGSSDVPLITKDFVSQEDKKTKPDIDLNWEALP